MVHQSTIQDLHPEINIGLLCQYFADNLGELEDVIEDYMAVASHLPAYTNVRRVNDLQTTQSSD